MGDSEKIRINFTLTEEGDGDLYHEIAKLDKRMQARKLRSLAQAGMYANRFAGQPREILAPRPSPSQWTAESRDLSHTATGAPTETPVAVPSTLQQEAVQEKSATLAESTEQVKSAHAGSASALIDLSIMDDHS